MLATAAKRTVLFLTPLSLALLIGTGCAAKPPAEAPWRGGWCSIPKDVEQFIARTKEVKFNALIAHGPAARMREFSERARERGIESYYWFSLTSRDKAMATFRQVMRPEDDTRLAELRADKDPRKHGYQFGSEPLPGHHDVLMSPLLCFHSPDVAAHCRKKIKEILDACPALTGIALDYFGYQNYRNCQCPRSKALVEQYRKTRPDLTEEQALVQFSRDSLVAFTNAMADYVRTVRPGAKVAIHVYPVFQPEPLYGNRLDVDYCCQTVAWFFKPYWPREKVARYSRVVVNESRRHHRRQQGIPFVGVYVGRPMADKSPERLAEELAVIRETTGSDSLSICSFNNCIANAKMFEVLKRDAERLGN